jgi:hypothetical protein
MAYDLQKQKWVNANKKCVAVIKNTIEPTIMGSLQEWFYGSSKTYATQLIKQLVTERYTQGGHGNGIREHISKMNHLNNKLKSIDLALTEEFLVHLIFLLYQKSLTLLLSTTTFSPRNRI